MLGSIHATKLSPRLRRLRINLRAKFLHQTLGDDIVRIARASPRHQLSFSIPVETVHAYVIALRQHLIAAAHAHELAADALPAVRLCAAPVAQTVPTGDSQREHRRANTQSQTSQIRFDA